jgi:hypothetical protein
VQPLDWGSEESVYAHAVVNALEVRHWFPSLLVRWKLGPGTSQISVGSVWEGRDERIRMGKGCIGSLWVLKAVAFCRTRQCLPGWPRGGLRGVVARQLGEEAAKAMLLCRMERKPECMAGKHNSTKVFISPILFSCARRSPAVGWTPTMNRRS